MNSIKNIQINNTGFVSVAELFVRSVQNGSTVKEFPCTLSIRQIGESKIHILSAVIDHLKFMLRILTR